MHDSIDLSVVIVTWNSAEDILRCVLSASKSAGSLNTEILIIDNASADGTIDELRKVVNEGVHKITIIENNSNEGFTKANNKGIEIAKGKNILLLNPDAFALNDCIEVLFRKLESNGNLGAVAPQLLNEDGSVQYSCRTLPHYSDMFSEMTLLSSIFPKSRVFSRWKMRYFAHDVEQTVEQPMAAAIMVRSEVIKKLGGFDERFSMFFNDVDLCGRILETGSEILFCPDAKMIHKKGASVNKAKVKMIDTWNEDCRKYFDKHDKRNVNYFLLNIGLTVTGMFRKIYHKLF